MLFRNALFVGAAAKNIGFHSSFCCRANGQHQFLKSNGFHCFAFLGFLLSRFLCCEKNVSSQTHVGSFGEDHYPGSGNDGPACFDKNDRFPECGGGTVVAGRPWGSTRYPHAGSPREESGMTLNKYLFTVILLFCSPPSNKITK